ncbi:putative acetyl-CoA carboxylase beta subunit like protein [Pseudoloma neurophilia]|uniref:Putative acetyl-CoA carboxylase beta subunit like protein n=1 Tax=Pseudoloma neurophilia TaxID=146866 RepID=A0A0R0M6I8_9MICR|nr:putative acetyl-CoA carboxylase beta subunit like protein [Pseudoloma neurophilia]
MPSMYKILIHILKNTQHFPQFITRLDLKNQLTEKIKQQNDQELKNDQLFVSIINVFSSRNEYQRKKDKKKDFRLFAMANYHKTNYQKDFVKLLTDEKINNDLLNQPTEKFDQFGWMTDETKICQAIKRPALPPIHSFLNLPSRVYNNINYEDDAFKSKKLKKADHMSTDYTRFAVPSYQKDEKADHVSSDYTRFAVSTYQKDEKAHHMSSDHTRFAVSSYQKDEKADHISSDHTRFAVPSYQKDEKILQDNSFKNPLYDIVDSKNHQQIKNSQLKDQLD